MCKESVREGSTVPRTVEQICNLGVGGWVVIDVYPSLDGKCDGLLALANWRWCRLVLFGRGRVGGAKNLRERPRRMSTRLEFSALRRDCGCGCCRSVTNLIQNQLIKRSRTGHTLSIRLDAVFAKQIREKCGGMIRLRSATRWHFYA